MQRTFIIIFGVAVANLTGCIVVEDLSGRISEQMRAAEQNRQQAQMETARKRCVDDGYDPSSENFAACLQKEFADRSTARPTVAAGCTLYEHANYAGMTYRLRPNSAVNALHGFNDKASSVRVAGSCSLELYEHDDYRGERRVLQEDAPELGRAWNDRVSSAKCLCR